MHPLPLAVIVGSPNVGKSTLFNRLVGNRLAIVTNEPGATRDRLYGRVRGESGPFRVVDTGGLVPGHRSPLARGIEQQAEAALSEASVALFVVDARAGLTALDREIAQLLRKRSLPIIVVANKIDVPSVEPLVLDLHELGLGEPVAVSAAHGHGIGDLLQAIDRVVAPTRERDGEDDPERPPVRVAIVGRPNVGKSSLLNRLLGEDRTLVSEIPGTTRDAVDTLLEKGERRYILVDTAGIRRRGKVHAAAEAASVVRARSTIERADVVVLVLDALEGIVAQDTHIAGYAAASRKPLVIVANKWDLVERREDAAKLWVEEVRRRFRFAKEAPFVLVSARTGQRVSRILDEVDHLHAGAGLRVPTPELNRWLQKEGQAERSTPARGRSVRLFYAAQTGVRPPRFVLFCNDARRIHFSLRRRLENSLRERFGFGAAPIHLTFRSRREGKSR